MCNLNYRDKPLFGYVDFEFTHFGRDNVIIISGAIAGRNQPGFVTKLEGRALILNENRTVNRNEWKRMVKHLINIFRGKPKHLFPILAQVYDSDNTTNPNLTATFIKQQLDAYEIIIVWEGSMDYKILTKLKIVNQEQHKQNTIQSKIDNVLYLKQLNDNIHKLHKHEEDIKANTEDTPEELDNRLENQITFSEPRGTDIVEFPLSPRNSPKPYPKLRTFLRLRKPGLPA
ncbi:hypothetical protein ACI65C_013545 [Semiaphis heraclei]